MASDQNRIEGWLKSRFAISSVEVWIKPEEELAQQNGASSSTNKPSSSHRSMNSSAGGRFAGRVVHSSKFANGADWAGRKVLVTYHPSYLARRGFKAGERGDAHEDADVVLRALVAAGQLAEALR